MKRAVVFSGGSIGDYVNVLSYVRDDDFVVCADSGVYHCLKLGINVDLLVGDFDSTDFETACTHDLIKNSEVLKLNSMKDDTDTEHAIDVVLNRGYNEILVFAAVGTRLDHTISNIFLLEKYLDKNANITIISDNNIIHVLKNSSVTINKSIMKYVSVLPLDDVTVSNRGFLYPLTNELMHRSSSRGISNELTSDTGCITVENGCALVIESKD